MQRISYTELRFIYVKYIHKTSPFTFETMMFYSAKHHRLHSKTSSFTLQYIMFCKRKDDV
ncbi:hypothetical protein HMPREF3202_01531 [Prevotella bivia]|uniref:Uncharacterized protein n=1 Tax=Prevotella bivia TaxID=28125 RepID=A0A137STY7_9BACT|nr:hypothetical protein HMPREF3202_01531 [Prevotella bivia]